MCASKTGCVSLSTMALKPQELLGAASEHRSTIINDYLLREPRAPWCLLGRAKCGKDSQ
jgi:hypothetical protein